MFVKLDVTVPVGTPAKLSSFLPAPYTNKSFGFMGRLTAFAANSVIVTVAGTELGTSGQLVAGQIDEFRDGVDLDLITVVVASGTQKLGIAGVH
jgi:hypothetical protein